jgi:hypothetical protein
MVAAALLSLIIPIVPSPHDCDAKSDADESTPCRLHVAMSLTLIALHVVPTADRAFEQCTHD